MKKKKGNNLSFNFFSPAKINLFFRLKSKRDDGYHNLESLFQAISLGDHLTISLSTKDEFSTNVPYLSFDDQNLVIKALRLFRLSTHIEDPISIFLDKKVPIQTGLGGGSSNGATLLWALNRLFKTNLSVEFLTELAAQISSDSPFFFSEGTALCTGRGDQVHNIKALEPQRGWIVKPAFGISTPQAYACVRTIKKSMPINLHLESFYTKQPHFQNDLEQSACYIEPLLGKLKQELMEEGIETVFMTGSGSGLVCLGKTPPKPKKTIQIYPFHYINRSHNQWYSE